MSARISNKIRNMGILCAMLVAFIHVGRPSVVGSSGWWVYQLTAEGMSRIAVPFFFICSGYFLAAHFTDKHWYIHEIGKRIKTLLVPYLLWSLIFYLFIYVLYNILPNNPICWRMRQEMAIFSRILLALGLSVEKLPMLYPLWYLRFLFLLVVLSPVLAWGAKHLKVELFACLGAMYLAFNPGDGSAIGIHIGFPFEGALFFYCGIILHDERIRAYVRIKKINGKYVFLMWSLVWMLIISRAVLLRYVGAGVCFFKPLFIPIGIIAVWSIIPEVVWTKKFVSLSFLVYVTHVFGLHLFSFVFGRDSDSALMLLLRVGFGLLFAISVSHLLKNVIGNTVGLLWGCRR